MYLNNRKEKEKNENENRTLFWEHHEVFRKCIHTQMKLIQSINVAFRYLIVLSVVNKL